MNQQGKRDQKGMGNRGEEGINEKGAKNAADEVEGQTGRRVENIYHSDSEGLPQEMCEA